MHALRQGDVLIRPSTEKLMVESNDVDWPVLQSIWNSYLAQVKVTEVADRDAAQSAVTTFYVTCLKRQPPRIQWYDGGALESAQTGVPHYSLTDVIFASLHYEIPSFHRIIAQLGYDMHQGNFRLTDNKRLLSGDFRLRGRSGTRPPWTRSLGNLVSQFDVPALVLFDYAVAIGRKLDTKLIRHAEALKQILRTCFGAFIFHDACVMLDRPLEISFDPSHILSATTIDPLTMARVQVSCPAYEPRYGTTIYAVNGIVIPTPIITQYHAVATTSSLIWNTLVSIGSPRVRAALIAYMGWGRFLEIVPRLARHVIDKSQYGTLIEVQCNLQEIMVVQVTNSTPEPDGTRRKYVLPVDHDCRPLPNAADPTAVMGQPQLQTALNAVASTFGMTGREYAAMVQAES